jgi:hypothetical protein
MLDKRLLVPYRSVQSENYKNCRVKEPLCSLHLSDSEWRELRSQMGQLCWHLTCDRYWGRQPPHRRGISQAVGILVVFLAVALIYLTFSYYVIWIVF